MSMPRTSIADLKLSGSSNLKRALEREALKPLAKREELESIFSEVKARHIEALADVKKRGAVIWEDRWKGPKLIRVQVTNPYLKIAQQCERQMSTLAKQLTAYGASDKPAADPDVEAIFAEFEDTAHVA